MVRTWPTAVGLALALLAPGSVRASAAFTPVAVITGPLVAASPGPLAVADGAPGTIVVFDTRSGRTRPRSVPPDCHVSLAQGAYAALLCGREASPTHTVQRLVVVNLRSGSQAVARVAPQLLAGTQSATAGAHWVELLVLHGYSSVGKEDKSRVLVDWRSGAAIDEAKDPFGARKVIDLDEAGGTRRLCGPLRRAPGGLPDYDVSRFARTTYTGRWLLQDGGKGYAELQRCGARRVRRIGASAEVALADDVLTVQQHSARIRVERLSGSRISRFTVPGVRPPRRTTAVGGRAFLFATQPTVEDVRQPMTVLRVRV